MPLVAAAVCPCPPLMVPEIAAGAAGELDDLRAACDAAVGRLLAARPDGILIMGTGPETAWRDPDEYGTLAPWGLPLEVVPGRRGRPDLPLSLTIGAWLLSRNTGPAPVPPAPQRARADRATTDGNSSLTPGSGGAVAMGGRGPVPVGMASVAPDEPPAGCAAFGRDRCASWLPRVALLAVGDGSACRGYMAPGYDDPRAPQFDAAVAQALATADVDGLLALDPALAEELMAAGRPAWQVLAGAASGADWRAEMLYDAAPYGVGYLVAAWEPA